MLCFECRHLCKLHHLAREINSKSTEMQSNIMPRNDSNNAKTVLLLFITEVSLLISLNKSNILCWCLFRGVWTGKCLFTKIWCLIINLWLLVTLRASDFLAESLDVNKNYRKRSLILQYSFTQKTFTHFPNFESLNIVKNIYSTNRTKKLNQ